MEERSSEMLPQEYGHFVSYVRSDVPGHIGALYCPNYICGQMCGCEHLESCMGKVFLYGPKAVSS